MTDLPWNWERLSPETPVAAGLAMLTPYAGRTSVQPAVRG